MKIKIKAGDFILQNPGKVTRVIENTTTSKGDSIKGLGNDADPSVIIAAYDRIAGHITGKQGAKVKRGCFYDFENKKAFEKPEIVYTFRVGKKTVDVPAGEEMPLEVQAAHQVKQEEVKELKKKAKKEKDKK